MAYTEPGSIVGRIFSAGCHGAISTKSSGQRHGSKGHHMTDATPREEAVVTLFQVPPAVKNEGHDIHSLGERVPLCEL